MAGIQELLLGPITGNHEKKFPQSKQTDRRMLLRLSLIVWGTISAIASETALAQTPSLEVEAVAAIAAGSINPPSPIDGCNRAKQNATNKAADAGYKGKVDWIRLSNDSDCSLHTEGATGRGFVYIFTAKERFSK